MTPAFPFDSLRAAREELAGLVDVYRTLIQRERICEENMAKAETELNAIRKILGYARITQNQLKARIEELETQT